MDAPLLGSKPKSAIPSYLTNGNSSPHSSVGAIEKEKLVASITSSNEGRQPLEYHLDGDESYTQRAARSSSTRPTLHSPLARDPRDSAVMPVPNRPASPYTLNPPIDFDGLSWPSE